MKKKLVAQGANIPFTAEAERILHKTGTLVLPDFIANAGRRHLRLGGIPRRHPITGVANHREKIYANTEEVLASSKKKRSQAAVALAEARVRKAMTYQSNPTRQRLKRFERLEPSTNAPAPSQSADK